MSYKALPDSVFDLYVRYIGWKLSIAIDEIAV